jgi:hypothetical protein
VSALELSESRLREMSAENVGLKKKAEILEGELQAAKDRYARCPIYEITISTENIFIQ